MEQKLKLFGFNNLTKSLSFNIYDVCYAKNERDQRDYLAYINKRYDSECLKEMLVDVSKLIDATVLNISKYDYEPHGASATLLIAEEPPLCGREKLAAHLDKSHVTVHTYPEHYPGNPVTTFRVDIDVATCGEISPLSTLNYLIGSFDSDIITLDYKVRGVTRSNDGKKLFIDHKITSIQNFISDKTLQEYDVQDINIHESNIFHTKMIKKDINLKNHLFNAESYELPSDESFKITETLRREMTEIFNSL